MRKKFLVCGLVTALIAGTAFAATTYNYTLAGASPGGLWSLLGIGSDAAVKAAYPGSTITYQTSAAASPTSPCCNSARWRWGSCTTRS